MTTSAATEQSETLKDEAIEWLIRLSAENCPTADLQAFEQWIQQSAAHQAAYGEIAGRMGWLERVTKADTETRNAALRYRPTPQKQAKNSRIRLATAASVLLVLGIATFSSEGWYGNHSHYQVARGGHETIQLADGSRLEMNTDSEVSVLINHWQRSVEVVRGEVYFSVVHDAEKPFIVTAGAGRSIDIGTEFDVYRQPEQVIIAVQEGSVRVEAKQSQDLIASQAVAYNQDGDFINLPGKLSLDSVTAWRRGKLIFDNRRLDEVLAEMGRYHNAHLRLDAPTLASNKVSGTFFIDRLEGNLAAIANSLNLTVRHVSAGEIVLAKR
ncbi:FecR family protein [Methylomonas methanica]|uniref:Anti-FecI sigma factor, FecR n=1 Tax=Methylomonas methanica (strain DSM 25384 / MC09) TaxID=857087 RepID=G0A2Z5_METMM|nr:FecR family protein [Methylomonas methanica]AEG02654.1 anti-FecI sigma factor, FecR [Methylomonas methanica MC09]